MRLLKTMLVAALGALAIVACAGVSTAAADRWCSVPQTHCPIANIYPADEEIDWHLVVATTFTTSGSPVGVNPTLTCSAGTRLDTSTTSGGTHGVPVLFHTKILTFSGCSSANPTGCSSTPTIGSTAAATGFDARTGHFDGTRRYLLPTVTFHCPILGMAVACTFGGGTSTVHGTITAGNPAILHITNQALSVSGGFGCPTAAQWNARYRSTVPLYISTT